MRYSPRSSVTALRTFSMRAGLEASTVTPGITAPDASVTVPETLAPLVPCAEAGADMKVRHTTARRPRHGIRYMDDSFPRKRDRQDAGTPRWIKGVSNGATIRPAHWDVNTHAKRIAKRVKAR